MIEPDELKAAIERFGTDYQAMAGYLNGLDDDTPEGAGFTRDPKPFKEAMDEWLGQVAIDVGALSDPEA